MQITRYDETLVDARAVNLTNSIGTVDIDVPVGFSCPTGAFRLSEPNNITFTHFTADVPSLGGNRVFKITSLTCINSKVTEYYYDIDYLKDYWFRYSTSGSPTLSLPNTLISSYYCQDDVILSRTIFPVNQHKSSIASSSRVYSGAEFTKSSLFIVVNCSGTTITPGSSTPTVRSYVRNSYGDPMCNKQVYYLDDITLLDRLNGALLKGDADAAEDTVSAHTNYSAVYSNISNVFYAPFAYNVASHPNEVHDTNGFMYFIDKDGRTKVTDFRSYEGSSAPAPLDGHLYYLTSPSAGNSLVEADACTGFSMTFNSANDLPPYKEIKIFVPYIGWYDLPLTEIFTNDMFAATQYIWVRLYYDLLNGKVACRFGLSTSDSTAPVNYSIYQTPFVPLPSAPVLTSNYAANITTAQNQYASSMQSNAITSLMGLGAVIAPAVTGNIPLAAAGLAGVIGGDITRRANAENAREQANKNNGIGGFTSSKDSDLGQSQRQFLCAIITYKSSLTVEKASELYGYPINEYTDLIDLTMTAGLTKSTKAWLDVSNSTFIGPEWYVSKVRDEFNRDYVTYAVTGP